MATYLEIPVGEIVLGRKPCPGCGSADHGPPALLGPGTPRDLSISHSAGLAMLAAAPFPVGIDTEAIRDIPVANISGNVLTPRERLSVLAEPEGLARTKAFLRCWTRKEAVLKAVGIGIVTDLTLLETRAWSEGPAEVTVDALVAPSTWRVADVPVPEGWAAALALPAAASRNVTVRHL
ncbi:4'-phosphopantetheinyl transferase superfamily protein [Streptomyces sp. NPDC048442]|uniref:4'-phosphopantetheinyl transferase family protein n=1 Tax=Streptomyces sp. NPDC048442 TaxID=3154823 RepID=UPI0034307A9E